MNIPLFPLNTVLFPGGPLPLRVFEPRYLDMVSRSMKTETPIGVVLIKSGDEVGPAPEIYTVGTLAVISYWHKRTDGLLGITLTATQRFRVKDIQVNDAQLMTADIEVIKNIEPMDVHDDNRYFIPILEQILEQLDPPFKTMQRHMDDMEWMSARLIELLPTGLEEKQALLESDNIEARLARIESILKDAKH
ncbi:Uncharacterized protein, similar to the N-terminal domain of Lon protease [hydrothermal vent metagenome]|uniref:Uncharacterized protein, similar to the N-terminal domain of Lon protease n=1 Tax=hydrothermal vent metagenome TaxID=652676 RepID=A0A3B1A1V7_9ZZZZ